MPTTHFSPALFAFLRDLAANNDRAWFLDNKERYLASVQEPALEFITDFGPRLRGISPHFTADARVVGGSLFRIQRDTRFSKDKTPYKLNTGVQFRHESAGDAHVPAFYLHLQPGECFAGVGIWRPPSADAGAIRRAIVSDPGAWKKAAYGRRFRDVWAQGGESLKRPPKGFDAEHPWVEDLRRKDFIASTQLTQKQVTSPGFVDEYAGMCGAAAPYVRFLCEALDLPF
jgi:uncharacterized protein (TIGR02453 family)